MKRYIFIILSIIFVEIVATAQVSFTTIPPRNVIEGEKFTVTFRLKNGETNNIEAPEIDGCTLIYGPSTSTMHSMQMVNGTTTSSTATDYSFVYKADKQGTFKIPEISVSVDGKSISSNEVSFTVLPAEKQIQKSTNTNNLSDINVSNQDIIVRIILSKNKVYEQEAIDCTVKLYTKYQLSSFAIKQQPTFNNFIIEDIAVQSSLNNMEHYNGQNYMTAILKKCIIFPQKSGTLTISPGKYEISVIQYERVGMGFFSQQRPIEKQVIVNSNSPSITVIALPQPQPVGFTGAVGNFSLDVKLSNTSLKTNEVASLVYTIKGNGNIKNILDPVVDFPSEFEQYTPKTEITTNVSGGNVIGTKTIEYTFSPRNVGEYKIGENKFVFFDLSQKKYKTISIPEYIIKVGKGNDVSTPSISTIQQNEITTKNTDILHIKLGTSNLLKEHKYIVYSSVYWLLYVVVIIILIIVVILYKKHINSLADIQGQRLSKANKMAVKRLKEAKVYMTTTDSDKFYEELEKAVWGYLSDKLLIPVSLLSRENISLEMSKYGADEAIIAKFLVIIEECEMARYSPIKTEGQNVSLYNNALEAIKEFDNIKKRKK